MENAIERMAGIAFLAIGLSHLLRPLAWVEFFAHLRALGATGALINGMMSLTLGALMVGFHGTQWSGLPAIVTFIGWAQVAKGTIHICFPAHGLKSMELVTAEHSRRFVWAGAVMIPLAGAILAASVR